MLEAEALLTEGLGDIAGNDTTKELVVLAGLYGDGDGEFLFRPLPGQHFRIRLAPRVTLLLEPDLLVYLLALTLGGYDRHPLGDQVVARVARRHRDDGPHLAQIIHALR